MEDANDADGPNGGRRAHKKKIRRIEDSDESEGDTENNQLTSCRKSNRPAMDHTFQRSSSEGSDDTSDSSDDIDSVNTDESIEEDSNESNADLSSEWDTESENEEVEEDISRPSTSRACTQRSRNSSHSSILPDKELSPSNLLSDRVATEGPADNVEGKVIEKVQDDFHGSSSETDDGEGPKTRCPICLKSLRGPGGAEVGSPEGCQHCFCVPCIQEWAKNVNTCPVDRHEFSEIVVLDGVCGKEIRRLRIPRKTRSSGTQDDDDVTLISQIEEDPTYCEVCGSGDREDSLLLCDGCDRGYHLECLIPPLTSVPIEEWFCPSCTEAATSRLRSARATRGMRLLPRTSASQRVLRNLRRNVRIERGQRGLRTWNLATRDLEVMEELAELEVERRWAESMSNSARPSTSAGSSRRKPIKKKRKVYRKKTTRKKRKTVTKKRTILGKDGEEEEEEVEEEEVTTTSKRKARRRRKMASSLIESDDGGRRSRRTRRGMVKRFKNRARLAESLGMGPGKDNLLRRKGACGRGGVGGAAGYYGGDGGVVLNGTTSGVGSRVPTLSIFGSSNDLEYFSGG
ncbi:hypothetical protein J437_LFUL010853 [Ladona fulva]|uniref:PHD and RING finger domain-containing protein 1 n=1 Tax=Ladona fulva TaxID=123851 RepID=A0A8K0NZK0_LADFU|nr:hypothetical protein J437_LFUL010853 [Ladona fulva]